MTGEWCCTECGSHNAYQETFNDDEVGHIMGCDDCGYYDVYRESRHRRYNRRVSRQRTLLCQRR